jgi:hypothetical protein
MRAMVYRSPYEVRVEDKDPPKIEHPNDAVVPNPARSADRSAIGGFLSLQQFVEHGQKLPGPLRRERRLGPRPFDVEGDER